MRAVLIFLAGTTLLALLTVTGAARADAGLEAPALLEDHAPIRIDADQDFDAAHGVRGGNGSAEDPYRIAGWRIRDAGVHVRVANTTKAFELRNLELHGLCQPNANGTACALEAGIHVENTSGFVVAHNRIVGMDRAGISLERVHDALVVANLIEGGGGVVTGAGLLLRGVEDVEVLGDEVVDVGALRGNLASAGVRVWDSARVHVADTRVTNATETCANVLGSGDVVFEEDELGRCPVGLAAQGRDIVVRATNFTGHAQHAILADRGSLRVEHSRVAANLRGITLGGTAFATLAGNRFEGNAERALAVQDNATADARGNWWGAAGGPNVTAANGTHLRLGAGQRILLARAGQASWDPWLDAAPADAGAHAAGAPTHQVSASPASATGPVAVVEGPTEGNLGALLEFSAARSLDPEGSGLRYAWSMGDNTSAHGPRARHAYAVVGEYLVQLTVTDSDGASAQAALRVRVVRPPLGVRMHVNASVDRGAPLEVTAEATGQPLGPVRFRFTAAGPGSFTGAPGAENRTTLRLDAPGEALVGVEASAGGEQSTAFERVLVRNHPPLASIAVTPGAGDTETTFHFTGEASDADGDALSYRWETGSGQRGEGLAFAARFPRAGTQVIELTVGDGFDAARAQVTVLVLEARRAPPQPTPGLGGAAALLAMLGVAGALGTRRSP